MGKPYSHNILVTGSNGQLGSELRDLSKSYPGFHFIFTSRDSLSIEDHQGVEDFIARNDIGYCINCAAYTAVDKAESEPEKALSVNAVAVGNLARVCKKHTSKLIHVSTDYVYDGTSRTPLKEDAPTHPVNVYGKTKLKGEQLALSADTDVLIVRTSWVYSSYGHNFLKTMMRLLSSRDELRVVADQFGCPTYAADLAAAIMQLIGNISDGQRISGIYNFSNAGVTTWHQFASLIGGIIKSDCIIHPVTTQEYPTPAQRPLYSVLDTTKIRNEPGIKIPDWKQSAATCLKKILSAQ